MNQELEKLKQKVKEIGKKADNAKDVKVDADEAGETLSLKVEKDPTTMMMGGNKSAEEDFDLDFSQINLSDDDVIGIIETASERAKQKSGVGAGGGFLGGSAVPQIVLTRGNTLQGEMWIIKEECSYTTEDDSVTIKVPKGFITDLASVPRVFWAVLASFELSLAAPVIHDLIYRCAGQVPNDYVNPSHVFERDETDELFLELMEKSGVSWWRRRAAYRAVRTFASFAWNNKGVNIQP